MKILLFASCVALALSGLFASNVSAQTSADCCCGTANTIASAAPTAMTNGAYQRFSYEPTASMPYENVGGVVQSQQNYVQNQPTYFRSQPSYAPSRTAIQSYRRFSYQPTGSNRANQSGDRKEKWEYSKGDPRKQQH